jgi:hypothetical protein
MLAGPGWRNFLAFCNLSFGRMVRPGRKNMKLLLVTAVTITTALAVSPASAQKAAPKAAAQKTGCTSENMAKLVSSTNTMPDSPGKFAVMKEMGAANAAMSKGDMRSACKSYMRAQQMSGQKS